MRTVCKRCQAYLLVHQDPKLQSQGWKRCPSCGWCCDKEGYNLIDKKEEIEHEISRPHSFNNQQFDRKKEQ